MNIEKSSLGSIRQITFCIGVVLLTNLIFGSVLQGQQTMELTQKFTGKIADPNLRSVQPKTGFLESEEPWKKLWEKWRPELPMPKIDFQTQIVLVNCVDGPNLLFASQLQMNVDGELKFETASTRMAGPGFGYLIMVIPKAGLKVVNGQPVQQPVAAPPAKPPKLDIPKATSPIETPVTAPVDPKPEMKPETESPDTISPDVEPSLSIGEIVFVEVIGRVRTQVQSVAGETTGTLVAANGIVWELDLQQDPKLIKLAREVGTSLVRVKGTLRLQRQRGAIEARVRWIVGVTSFENLNIEATIPPAEIADQGPPAVLPDNPSESTPSNMKEDPVPVEPQSPQSASPSPRAQSKTFKRLLLVTSDGQIQSVAADGSAHYESQGRNISNDWTVNQAAMDRLHQFVADTQLDRIPKLTRSQTFDPNDISYTISIETARQVTRIFIDRAAVPNQPEMKELFDIIGEMSSNR